MALMGLPSTGAVAAPVRPGGSGAASPRSLLDSQMLWATIDVCNPTNAPDTVGVRGSMPGDGHPGDRMYMSFRLQYLEEATKTWHDLLSGSTPGFSPVGPGASTRQGGRSFKLMPVAGKPPATLRGVVDFQWREGTHVRASAARATAAGHHSLAGADPKDYSAATCAIG